MDIHYKTEAAVFKGVIYIYIRSPFQHDNNFFKSFSIYSCGNMLAKL